MVDPDKLFSLETLNEEEIGQLEFILASPAWAGYLRPYLQVMIHSVERLMKDRSEERKKRYNDDFLAGQCTALEGFLAFADATSQSINMARMGKVQQLTPNQEYERLRVQGLVRHSGQTAQADDLVAFEEY